MTVLIRKLFWFAIFLASTFGFYVFFEHGTTDFPDSARTEFEALKTKVQSFQTPEKKLPPSP